MLWNVLAQDGRIQVEADGCTVNNGALVFYDEDFSRIESARPASRVVRIFGPGAYLEAWPVLQEAKPLEDASDAQS